MGNKRRNDIQRIKMARGAHPLSHLFLADDSYICYKANVESSNHIVEMLNKF